MSDEVFQAIGQAASGYVEAAAGCGKTEAIVRTVENYCAGTQLILTHTHAGVDALRQRCRRYQVPAAKYHIDTIAGWSWGWVRRYPRTARYDGSTDFAEWNEVYPAMINLLQHNFVRQGVLNSYRGIIVDEYQDCTISMHNLVVELSGLLPCRILGDDLQGVFDFNDPLVNWLDVRSAFGANLGSLDTPHRWIKADNECLGRWLISARPTFRQGDEPNFIDGPVDRQSVVYRNLSAQLIRLTREKQGRICVIGPKSRTLGAGTLTTLVKQGYRVLEPNDLSELRKLVIPLVEGTAANKASAAITFLSRAFSSISTDDKTFIAKILRGESQRPRRGDRRALCDAHTNGTTPTLLLELLAYVDCLDGVRLKLHESVSALTCILEEHLDSGCDIASLYADEIARRKYQSRSKAFRCTGSTLLVKGLEFDHAVVLRGQNWGNHRDLYVALTRGAKSVTLMELEN